MELGEFVDDRTLVFLDKFESGGEHSLDVLAHVSRSESVKPLPARHLAERAERGRGRGD